MFSSLKYLSILPGYNADILAAALLMSHCNFSPLIFSIVMTDVCLFSNIFFDKGEAVFDGRLVSVAKLNMFLQYTFCPSVVLCKVFGIR